MNTYWWAYGIDATGQIAVAGEYNSQSEAESDASSRGIIGLQGVVCLPTKNMQSAKQHIKYILAKNAGDLSAGTQQPMRSN